MQRRQRRAILEEHGLFEAPVHCKRAFWQGYNLRRRRPAAKLGELATELLSGDSSRLPRRLGELTDLWRAVVPADCKGRSRVEVFSRGRLIVIVDSAATKYFLGRQLGGALLVSLNDRLGGAVVKRIDYRIGSPVS